MGCTGFKIYKYKYFSAYRSIQKILKDIHSGIQSLDVYLVNVSKINILIEVFNQYNFFSKLKFCQTSAISNLEKVVLKKLENYEFKNIEIIEIKFDNFEKIKDEKFILVDEDFLKNMKIYTEENINRKITINIPKNDNDNKMKVEMNIEIIDDKNGETKRIFPIIEERDGIYKFGQFADESLGLINESNIDINENKNEDYDPEFDTEFRISIKEKGNKSKDDNENQNKNDNDENDKNNHFINDENQKNSIMIDNDENDKNNNIINDENQKNSIMIDNDENDKNNIDNENKNDDNLIKSDNDENDIIQEKKIVKALIAKLDDIIFKILLSINNSNIEKDIIMNSIQKKLEELGIDNELEEKEGLDIIGNIKTSVVYLLDNFNNNSNSNKKSQSLNEDNAYINNENELDVLNNSNENESKPLLENDIKESKINDEQKGLTNPFIFKQVKIFHCDKCDDPRNKSEEVECIKLFLNKECYNFEDCLKMKYFEKCGECGNNCEGNLKFETTPDILILVFDKPKNNKNYIKFNNIDQNIDLKDQLYQMNILDSSKYKLITTIYVFDDKEDNYLYVNIPNDENNNYIPYIIFYKKINNN